MSQANPRIGLRSLAAVLAGLAMPWSYAPYHHWYLSLLAMAVLFVVVRQQTPRRSAWLGWLFGLPYFALGVNWVYHSLHEFGAAAPPVAAAMTVAFVLVMTVFPALACFGFARLRQQPRPANALLDCVVFASCWSATELLRGWIMGGFPWLLLGYSQTDSIFSGFAPLVGVYGISWLAVVFASSCGLIMLRLWQQLSSSGAGSWHAEPVELKSDRGGDNDATRHPGSRSGSLAGALLGPVAVAVLIIISAGTVRFLSWSTPEEVSLQMRLVQGNIPQELKFSRERLISSLEQYTRLSEQQSSPDAGPIDIIVWPETAIPTYYANVSGALEPFVERMAAKQTDVLSGAFYRDAEGNVFNAFQHLGNPDSVYTKRHLVPFGEYMPLRFLFDFVRHLVIIPMSDLSRGSGPAQLLRVKGQNLGISICYEDVFGEEMAASFPGAGVLINVSNDAWFGDRPAPQQHQQIARMRALEFERPLLRATNTGISSSISHEGRVEATIGHGQAGFIDVPVIPRNGVTPYARFTNWPVIVISLAIILGVWARSRFLTQR